MLSKTVLCQTNTTCKMHHAATASNSNCKNKHIVCKSSDYVYIQEFEFFLENQRNVVQLDRHKTGWNSAGAKQRQSEKAWLAARSWGLVWRRAVFLNIWGTICISIPFKFWKELIHPVSAVIYVHVQTAFLRPPNDY